MTNTGKKTFRLFAGNRKADTPKEVKETPKADKSGEEPQN
jgi:hypothetical protein